MFILILSIFEVILFLIYDLKSSEYHPCNLSYKYYCDYPEYKIKDYSEDYDKQAPYPNIDIFDVFFYIGIHLILPLK